MSGSPDDRVCSALRQEILQACRANEIRGSFYPPLPFGSGPDTRSLGDVALSLAFCDKTQLVLIARALHINVEACR